MPGGGGVADLDAITAGAGDVLTGKVIVDKNGDPLSGTMPNRGAVSQSLAINGSYTIPAGYHNGSGKVSQSIPTQGGSTTTPGTANKTIVAAGRYVSGNIVVAGDPDLKAENIKKGVTIFGITGTHDGFVPGPLEIYNRGSWGSGYSINSISAFLGDSMDDTANSNYCTATKTAESAAIRFNFERTEGGRQLHVYGLCRLSPLINFAAYKSFNFIASKVLGRYESSSGADWHDIELYVNVYSQDNRVLKEKAYYDGGKDSGDYTPPSGEVTGSIDLSDVNTSGYLVIGLYHIGRHYDFASYDESHIAYIHKMWFT